MNFDFVIPLDQICALPGEFQFDSSLILREAEIACTEPKSHALKQMRILETVLYAEELVATRGFYVLILGLEEISFDADRDLFLRCDNGVLIIFKASRTKIADSIVPPHGAIGHSHMAFAVSHEEIESWKKKLQKSDVEITKEITWKNGAKSIYFCDPAGNVLEFATPDLWGME